MIKYKGGAFGFNVLLRMHGSAMFKATVPSLLSMGCFILFSELFDFEERQNSMFDHPYPMGALIAAFTFLISFKTSFSYGRYWEGATAVHQMHSKWLDVGMELAAFHLQSDRYRHPPAFGEYPEATAVKRERERLKEPTRQDLEEQLSNVTNKTGTGSSLRDKFQRYVWSKKPPPSSSTRRQGKTQSINAPPPVPLPKSKTKTKPRTRRARPLRAYNPLNYSSKPSTLSSSKASGRPSMSRSRASKSIIRSLVNEVEFDPSLFLQEGAHLISLLSAVALSTLRNDMEEAESPLCHFVPGAPWPHVDPDDLSKEVRRDWASSHRWKVVLEYLFGKTRTPKARTLYNAARPLMVVGGVSDAEIQQLQKARGPLAKVALCTMWLQEFMAREHLHGSTGAVGPPIISRLFQYTSDGMIGYNQARKIAYIPFPFPHAQITSLYVIVMVVFIPILMLSYVNNEAFGAVLTFFTVLCFTGLYEVSRELENPFKNVPNDIPLNNFQAQFNEALMTMYNGYHPDSWWVVEEAPLPPLLSTGESGLGMELEIEDFDESMISKLGRSDSSVLPMEKDEPALQEDDEGEEEDEEKKKEDEQLIEEDQHLFQYHLDKGDTAVTDQNDTVPLNENTPKLNEGESEDFTRITAIKSVMQGSFS